MIPSSKLFTTVLFITFFTACINEHVVPVIETDSWKLTEWEVAKSFSSCFIVDEGEYEEHSYRIVDELLSLNDNDYKETQLTLSTNGFQVMKDSLIAMEGQVVLTPDEFIFMSVRDTISFKVLHQSTNKLVLHTDEDFAFGSDITLRFTK